MVAVAECDGMVEHVRGEILVLIALVVILGVTARRLKSLMYSGSSGRIGRSRGKPMIQMTQ